MIASISDIGVVPSAYAKFVQYIVDNLKPTTNAISNLYVEATATVMKITVLLIFVLAIFTILIIAFVFNEGKMTPIGAILLFFLALGLGFVMFYSFVGECNQGAKEDAAKFQESISEATLYAFNSTLRDAIYLYLCK